MYVNDVLCIMLGTDRLFTQFLLYHISTILIIMLNKFVKLLTLLCVIKVITLLCTKQYQCLGITNLKCSTLQNHMQPWN